MDNTYGEWLALLTAFFWTFTAFSFERSARRIGSLNLNLLRLGAAALLLSGFSYFHRGMFLPLDAGFHRIAWLSLSGLIGFVLGDYLLFLSFGLIGARVSMLFMTLAPWFAALGEWVLLGQGIKPVSALAMVVTLAGISLVIMAHRGPKPADPSTPLFKIPLKAILIGIGAALGQGIGLVISKMAMQGYDAFASAQIRVVAGLVGFALLITFINRWKPVQVALRDTIAMKWLLIGSIFGPFLGVSFSLLSVKYTQAGTAQTIMSLVPVLIVPLSVGFNGERVTSREMLGALIAVGGVALFFL